MAKAKSGSFTLPLIYSIFFLVIEPISALVGAFYAHFRQEQYLLLTDEATSMSPIPRGTSMAMSQLANLYLLFALNEAMVLRSTADMKVWRRVLLVLLIADFGHLYTVSPLGWRIYWDVSKWNAIGWGNVPFVYLGASMRIAFLTGIGLGSKKGSTKKA